MPDLIIERGPTPATTRATAAATGTVRTIYSEADPIAVNQSTRIRLTTGADQDAPSGGGLAAFTVAVPALQTWMIRATLLVKSKTAGDIGGFTVSVTAPGGATSQASAQGPTTGAAVFGSFAGAGPFAAFGQFNMATGQPCEVTFYVQTGATPGNAIITIAASTGGQTYQLLLGSMLFAERVS